MSLGSLFPQLRKSRRRCAAQRTGVTGAGECWHGDKVFPSVVKLQPGFPSAASERGAARLSRVVARSVTHLPSSDKDTLTVAPADQDRLPVDLEAEGPDLLKALERLS